ncbi:uncharacterized protein DS421_19g671800 [Arachis hypogaea]|uniref:Uncharacterized protein n=1 Tax=Arachis hypogaea TaxID=3818 RepID=A0A6B9VDB7_ARAHY|nr:uncharacterized protein DS421_19g671800 [Arachis hypogaea]
MVGSQADDVFFMFSLKISCSITTGSKKTRKSVFGSLFLVQFLAAAKELDFECLCDGLIMRSCCLMLENQVFDGSEVVVVAAGKRGFPAMKFMIFDVFLMCI